LFGWEEGLFFCEFRWNGKNSHRERIRASWALLEHLQREIAANPDAKHVILAHSHGGTVAVNALARSGDSLPRGAISQLICMATPFAYVVPANWEHTWAFTASLASLIAPIPVLVITRFTDLSAPITTLLCLAIMMVTLLAVSLPLVLYARDVGLKYIEAMRDLCVPTTMLRGTRDEATLTIGLAQSVNWLIASPQRWYGIDKIKYAIAYSLFTLIAGPLVTMVIHRLHLSPKDHWGLVLASFAFLNGALYLAGYISVAIATGYFEIKSWPATLMEVDVTPPWGPCSIQTFPFSGPGREISSMRHALYARYAVQKAVATVIRSVAESRKD
jgi:hypothetical protein